MILAVSASAATQIDLAAYGSGLTIWGTQGNGLGRAVAMGDFDGDGTLDLAASEPSSPISKGRVCLYFGPLTLPLEIDRAVTTPATCIEGVTGEALGLWLWAADLDGDGMAELLEGETGGSLPKGREGTVAVFRGRETWPSVLSPVDADWAFSGAEFYLGNSDAMNEMTVGDVNGDGAPDLVLFAPSADGVGNLRSGSGEAYIFLGPTSRWSARTDLAVDAPDVVIYGADGEGDRNAPGNGNGDLLGVGTIAIVADVLGDAIPDLILSAPNASGIANNAVGTGEVYVLRGRPSWPSTIDLRNPASADLVVYGPEPIGLLQSTASADLDGDGKGDLILGAHQVKQATGRVNAGAMYLFRGGIGLGGVRNLATSFADATIVGANAFATLGFRIVTGDVNGDGYADIVASGFSDSPLGRPVAGKISVISGCAAFPANRDLAVVPAELTIIGADQGDLTGEALAVGDVNGDGKTDILSGGYQALSLGSARTAAGEVHLVLGQAWDASCTIAVDPGPAVNRCGFGDVTLDGSGSSVTGCPLPAEYRWLKGATVMRGWSTDPIVIVRPSVTTTYRLEVRCGDCSGPCFASDTVAVTVDPDITPPDLGNTLFATRSSGDVAMLWSLLAEARTYSIYRDVAKDAWPLLPLAEDLTGPTTTIPDVPWPPNERLYYYRIAGASCSGRRGRSHAFAESVAPRSVAPNGGRSPGRRKMASPASAFGVVAATRAKRIGSSALCRRRVVERIHGDLIIVRRERTARRSPTASRRPTRATPGT